MSAAVKVGIRNNDAKKPVGVFGPDPSYYKTAEEGLKSKGRPVTRQDPGQG